MRGSAQLRVPSYLRNSHQAVAHDSKMYHSNSTRRVVQANVQRYPSQSYPGYGSATPAGYATAPPPMQHSHSHSSSHSYSSSMSHHHRPRPQTTHFSQADTDALYQYFKQVDRDRSGRIDARELQAALKNGEPSLPLLRSSINSNTNHFMTILSRRLVL